MTTASAAAPKKRHIGKIIGIILAILIILLFVGYFVATSAAFLKGVILPRAGKSMNAAITVSDASISPFSNVVLTKLEVKPFGKDSLLKADEVRLRYNLRDIISGKITVDEVMIASPVITLVEAPDNTSNLDPITKQEKKPAEPKKTTGEPLNLNIKNVSLKNATLQRIKNLSGGGREVTEISNLNVTLDQLINGQSGRLTVSSEVRTDRVPSKGMTNSVPGALRGKLDGSIDFKITQKALPESAKGNLRFDVLDANGDMADLAKLAAVVACDLTTEEIRQISLKFEQGGQPLGELRVNGPFSLANTEGKLNVELSAIDRHVLNLAGASMGFDFNSTVINSTNTLVIAKKGDSISVSGQVNANRLSLTKKATKQTTPTLNFAVGYQVSVDQPAKSALIEKLDLNGTQNDKNFLRASISKPMPISWGGSAGAPEEAALQLAVTDFNLADWKSFLGETAPSGIVNATLDVLSKQAGKQLTLNANTRIDQLSAAFGSNHLSQAEVEIHAKATVAEMKKVSLSEYSVQLAQNNETALKLNGSAVLDLASNDADIKASMEGTLARLFAVVVVPDMTATSGSIKFDGQITKRGEAQTVKGNFALAGLSGVYAGSLLDRFGASFDADLEMNGANLQIRKLTGALQQAGQPGGTFEVAGNLNAEKKSGSVDLKLAGLNENALRPFLAKSLGDKQLVSIAINGNTTARLSEAESSFKANFDLKNFVVRDPKKAKADEPLAAQVQLDGAMRKDVFDLKEFQVTLSPTARAKNQLNVTGQIDLSKTNALRGKLLVQSDAFDVTPFYELYAAQPQPTATTTTPARSAPPTTGPSNQEPEPMKLPIEQLVAEIKIGQFYLREVEIKSWLGTAKVEGSRVHLNPFQLTLNGAPVKFEADLNLGVKGYTYTVAASLDKVPLAPLANSFLPPEKKDAYQGLILADANIKGAGTTGVSLKKSLSGYASFTFTNANLQIVDRKYKNILTPISLALQVPEVSQSPISWLDARLNFGGGNITLSNFVAVSDSYRASVQAVIPIADVLTNSPLKKIPVGFELRKTLADRGAKLGLASGQVSSDGQYVKLPNLIRLEGTLGDPKSDIDKKGLTTLALQASGGRIGGDAGKVLKGLGGILGGQTTPTTSAPASSTNNIAPAPASPNQQLLNNTLDLFKKKKK